MLFRHKKEWQIAVSHSIIKFHLVGLEKQNDVNFDMRVEERKVMSR